MSKNKKLPSKKLGYAGARGSRGERSSSKKLPKRLIAVPNLDKERFKERWTKGRDMLDFVKPFRMISCGPPGVGKTNFLFNVIARCNFERIIVIHCDPNTQEYNNIDCEILTEIPPPDSEIWNSSEKKLVVLDDINFKALKGEGKSNLNRLCGYVSTHKGVSLACHTQDFYQLDPIVKRCCNIVNLWKTKDLTSFSTIARRCGLKKDELLSIFRNLMPDFRDVLTIDLTECTPYPFRKNGYEIIDM